MRKKRSRKAISPLIATVLLVGFVIILAVLVFTWWDNIVKERAGKVGAESESQILCSLQLDYQVKDVCYDNDEFISFSVENVGDVTLDGFKVKIEGRNGKITVLSISDDIKEGAAKELGVDYSDTEIDTPERIELLPVVIARGAESVCVEKKEVITSLEEC